MTSNNIIFIKYIENYAEFLKILSMWFDLVFREEHTPEVCPTDLKTPFIIRDFSDNATLSDKRQENKKKT